MGGGSGSISVGGASGGIISLGGGGGGSGGGSRTRLQLTLTHESSMDQESSQLSQDSSNGSISQPDEDQSLSLASDTSLRFGRTGLDSPTTASTPVGGTAGTLATPPSLSSGATSGRGLGTSVIVGRRAEEGAGAGEGVGGSSLQGGSSPSSRQQQQQNTEQATSQGQHVCLCVHG